MISFLTQTAYLFYALISECNDTINRVIFSTKLKKCGVLKLLTGSVLLRFDSQQLQRWNWPYRLRAPHSGHHCTIQDQLRTTKFNNCYVTTNLFY